MLQGCGKLQPQQHKTAMPTAHVQGHSSYRSTIREMLLYLQKCQTIWIAWKGLE